MEDKDRDVLKITQELKREFRHKLDIAFAIMTVIPFLVFFYLLSTKLKLLHVLIGNTGLILAVTLILSFVGYLFGFSMLRSSLDEITRETESVNLAYAELRKTQELLLQAEKLKAIGELASGIAHEVRNPLGIILQDINYLEENGVDSETGKLLEMMKKNIIRADSIINTLVDFSRMSQINIVPVDVKLIIDNSISLVKKRAEFGEITLIKEINSRLPRVLADTLKMEQVLLNIFLNAVHAMPSGGRIFIRAYAKKIGELDILPLAVRSQNFSGSQEDAVVIEIEDNGAGIPKENLGRVFDPFFTTRGPKQGVGLGLTVARNIIDMHKGFINIDSVEGSGTSVSIILKTEGGRNGA